MKSPFPGMDSYLEASLWPDLHSSLAREIRNSLSASLPSRYSIRLEQSVYEDEEGESLGVTFRDVLVHTRQTKRPPTNRFRAEWRHSRPG